MMVISCISVISKRSERCVFTRQTASAKPYLAKVFVFINFRLKKVMLMSGVTIKRL